MGFDRFSAKMKARDSMRRNRPSPILVTLGYLLLTLPLAWGIQLFLFDPAGAIWEFLVQGYQMEEILPYLAKNYSRDILIFYAVSFLFSLYHTVMKFGYLSYALRMARDEQPGFTHIFDGFLRPVKVLWSALLQVLLVFLWCLPFQAAATGLTVWWALGGPIILPVLAWGCGMLAWVVGVAKIYSYRLTWYFMLDDPSCSSLTAISRSREHMAGWRVELLFFDLSFLAWSLVSALTLGLLGMWLMPYKNAAEANFYGWLTAGEELETFPEKPF